jgi:hypothetical protein
MSTTAIKRIKGYCTKVNQSQWEELVRVADEVGVDVSHVKGGNTLAAVDVMGVMCCWHSLKTKTLISFPDFLAKLRGVEEWTPKAGEMVEVEVGGRWFKSEVVAFHEGQYVCQMPAHIEYIPYPITHLRPLRPTITRAEAEQQLGKRIID